jgi:glutamate carboxypeptidase
VLSNRPAWTPGEQHDGLCAAIARAALTVGQTIEGRPASGAADSNVTGWLGIPSVDGLGPVGKGAHAAHEQIVVASLDERAALIAAAIVELSRHHA